MGVLNSRGNVVFKTAGSKQTSKFTGKGDLKRFQIWKYLLHYCVTGLTNASVRGKSVHQENVSRGHIFLGNPVLPDRIYCLPQDQMSPL